MSLARPAARSDTERKLVESVLAAEGAGKIQSVGTCRPFTLARRGSPGLAPQCGDAARARAHRGVSRCDTPCAHVRTEGVALRHARAHVRTEGAALDTPVRSATEGAACDTPCAHVRTEAASHATRPCAHVHTEGVTLLYAESAVLRHGEWSRRDRIWSRCDVGMIALRLRWVPCERVAQCPTSCPYADGTRAFLSSPHRRVTRFESPTHGK